MDDHDHDDLDGLGEIRSLLDMRTALSDDDSMMEEDENDDALARTLNEIREELHKSMKAAVAAIEQEYEIQHRDLNYRYKRIDWIPVRSQRM